MYTSTEIYLSASDSDDSQKCGGSGKPCQSANVALEHLAASEGPKTLRVSGQADVSVSVTFEELKVTKTGDSASGILHLIRDTDTIDEGTGSMIISKAGVVFQQLTFLLTNIVDDAPGSFILVSDSGDVDVSNTEFKTDTEILPNSCHLITVEGKMTFDTCIITGDVHNSQFSANGAISKRSTQNTDLCLWTGSLVRVNGRQADVLFKSTSITNSSIGAVEATGFSMVTFDSVVFRDNNPGVSGYPSLRRNVICHDSMVLVNSLTAGDGKESNTSLWMTGDRFCRFKGVADDYISWFFIPRIDDVDYNVDTGAQTVTITVFGELLIPCNLTLSITMSGVETEHQLSSTNETHATVVLTGGYYISFEDASSISFGLTGGTGDIQPSINKRSARAEASSDTSQWAVIIMIVLAVVALILVIVIVLICILQRRKSRKPSQTQMVLITEPTLTDLKTDKHDDPLLFIDTNFSSVGDDSDTDSEASVQYPPATTRRPPPPPSAESTESRLLTSAYSSTHSLLENEDQGRNQDNL